MTRRFGFALTVCLCVVLPASSARAQEGYGDGGWTQNPEPVSFGGPSAGDPSEEPRRVSRNRPFPPTLYTEQRQSGADLIRQAQAEPGSRQGGFALDSEWQKDSSVFAPSAGEGLIPPDEWSGAPEIPRTATRPDYLDAPETMPAERKWLDPDQLLLPDAPRTNIPVRRAPVIVPDHARFIITTLPGSGDDLGWTEFDINSKLIFPRAEGVWIAPGFGMVFTDGPVRTDLPPRLYNARLEVGYKHNFAPHVGVSLSVAPGIYSDFEQSSSDAWRVLGKAVGFLAFSEETQLILGVAYLDREDVRALPIVGVMHRPNDMWRLELVFPQPKIAYRVLEADGGNGWVYIAGEFGGDTWAIERANGRRDVVTYSDWRLRFGFEMLMESGRNLLFETGYVFNRELEYNSRRGNYDPSSTAMLRFGLTY